MNVREFQAERFHRLIDIKPYDLDDLEGTFSAVLASTCGTLVGYPASST